MCLQYASICTKMWMRKQLVPLTVFTSAQLSTSSSLCKNRRSAVPKITTDRSKALTYEQAQKPEHIGVRKSWNSWNTSM